MNSKWNSEFFDRYLHSECSVDECRAFEKELDNSEELQKDFREFRSCRDLIKESERYPAPDNFTDNVIREIRKKSAPSEVKSLFRGLFRREIIGLAASVLVLAVLFWPHIETITVPDESAIVEKVTAYQMKSSPDREIPEEMSVSPEPLSAPAEIQASPEKGVAGINMPTGSLQGAGGGASLSDRVVSTVSAEPQRLSDMVSSTVTKKSAPAEVPSRERKSFKSEALPEKKYHQTAAASEPQLLPRTSVKAKQSSESIQIEAYSDSYELEASEMLMEESSRSNQFPEPSHRGIKRSSEEIRLTADTLPSDKLFSFEKYHAVVSGMDTLHVTIPRRYLRRLVRDWEKSGGHVIDTVEMDSTVNLRLLSGQ